MIYCTKLVLCVNDIFAKALYNIQMMYMIMFINGTLIISGYVHICFQICNDYSPYEADFLHIKSVHENKEHFLQYWALYY